MSYSNRVALLSSSILGVCPYSLFTSFMTNKVAVVSKSGLINNLFKLIFSTNSLNQGYRALGFCSLKPVSHALFNQHGSKLAAVFSKQTLLCLGYSAGLIGLMMTSIAPANAAQGVKVGQRILMIEMTPALCSIYPSRARMRQCLEGYSLTVSGLDLGYGSSCGRGGYPDLTPLQLRVVNRVMPDASVRNQAWRQYGACSPMRASFYFRQIVTHASHLQLPTELNTGNSYTVSKTRFLQQLVKLNSGMSATGVDLICQNSSRNQSILTEIHICYEGTSFGRCPNRVDNCSSNFIISGGRK